jgi:hypothetical protein
MYQLFLESISTSKLGNLQVIGLLPTSIDFLRLHWRNRACSYSGSDEGNRTSLIQFSDSRIAEDGEGTYLYVCIIVQHPNERHTGDYYCGGDRPHGEFENASWRNNGLLEDCM